MARKQAKSLLAAKCSSDTDCHVGARVRERRIILGLSQQQMADHLGVTYQQAHKYERGINRISAGRLYEIAKFLGVPVGHFFRGLAVGHTPGLTKRQSMSLELVRNFADVTDAKRQSALAQMARALADD